MSSIPSSAMPHAKTHEKPEPDHAEQARDAVDAAVGKAKDGAKSVKDAAEAHPGVGIAIGAAVVAGIAAAVAVPMVLARKAADAKPAGKHKSAARKDGAKKPGAKAKADA